MKTDSIYGVYNEVLPQVMRTLTDKVIQFNWERVQSTGHPIYEHFNYRVKSEDSMREKCTRRGLPQTPESALLELKDSIGLRIITNFVDDIYKTAAFIRDLPNVTVITEKDYIKNVKPNGYRSYHMILQLEAPYEDIMGNNPGKWYAEVQLRTIAMDSWASLEHKMKYKKEIRNQELIEAELKRCADELAACDVSMETIRNLIRESTVS